MEIQRAAFGDVHPQVVRSQYALGRLLASLERPGEAIPVLEELIQAQRQLDDMLPAHAIYPLVLLAEQHAIALDCERALAYLGEALDLDPELAESPSLARRRSAIDSSCPRPGDGNAGLGLRGLPNAP